MSRLCWILVAGVSALAMLARADAQQVCDDAAGAASSPSARFVHDSDGTTVDQLTQLMWMRCPIGQSWSGQACAGSALRLNWVESSAAADRLNRAGSHFYNDWRVPSLRELATVAERQCHRPRINLQVFPDTPSAAFWTGTASLQDKGQAYALDFDAGGIRQASQDVAFHVRLVRSAP